MSLGAMENTYVILGGFRGPIVRQTHEYARQHETCRREDRDPPVAARGQSRPRDVLDDPVKERNAEPGHRSDNHSKKNRDANSLVHAHFIQSASTANVRSARFVTNAHFALA